jgi:hypothetical protein
VPVETGRDLRLLPKFLNPAAAKIFAAASSGKFYPLLAGCWLPNIFCAAGWLLAAWKIFLRCWLAAAGSQQLRSS